MRQVLFCMMVVAACWGPTCPRADYKSSIQITPAGEFGVYAEPSDQDQAAGHPSFGPGVGYPEPASVAEQDLGAVHRGSFVVFETSQGDLSEAVARITDADEQTVANPSLDPDSTPTRIGIKVSFDLSDGTYTLELRTPTDILIARVTFELQNPVF